MSDMFNLLDTFSDLSAGRKLDLTCRDWIFTDIYR